MELRLPAWGSTDGDQNVPVCHGSLQVWFKRLLSPKGTRWSVKYCFHERQPGGAKRSPYITILLIFII